MLPHRHAVTCTHGAAYPLCGLGTRLGEVFTPRFPVPLTGRVLSVGKSAALLFPVFAFPASIIATVPLLVKPFSSAFIPLFFVLYFVSPFIPHGIPKIYIFILDAVVGYCYNIGICISFLLRMGGSFMKSVSRVVLLFLLVLLFCGALSLSAAPAQGLPDLQEQAQDLLTEVEDSNPDIMAFAGSVLAVDSIDDANALLSQYSPAVLLIVVACALVFALFGYRLLKLAIAFGGFAAGWLLGDAVYSFLIDNGILSDPDALPAYLPLVICLVCGVLAALLARRLILFGIFLAAAAGCYFFLNGLEFFPALVDNLIASDFEGKYLVARLVVAIIAGILALIITRPILIITTAGAGGIIAGLAFTVVIGQASNHTLSMIIGLAVVLLGLSVQFGAGKRR